jgi:phosphinothricin acetyltransferase
MGGLIRDAKIEDLPRIVEIYNGAIPGRLATADLEPVTVTSRMRWFEEHGPKRYPLWVYEQEGVILAWISLQPFRDRPAYSPSAEFSIYVDPAHQKEGLGSLLLQNMIDYCPQIGIKVLLGLIFGHNKPSLQLVKKFGFKRWGCMYGVTELDGKKRDVVIVGLRIKAKRKGTRPFE